MSNRTAEDLETSLAHFHGTEGYYYDPAFPDLKYTDGVKFVFDSCIGEGEGGTIPKDFAKVIMKNSILRVLKGQLDGGSFLSVLIRQETGKVKITLSDGDGKDIVTLSLAHEVFLVPEIKMFCTNNVLMLTSEY